jgi:hypothetical protein
MREIRPGLQPQSRLVLPDTVVLTKASVRTSGPALLSAPLRGWVSALRLVPSYLSLHDRLTEGFEISLVTFSRWSTISSDSHKSAEARTNLRWDVTARYSLGSWSPESACDSRINGQRAVNSFRRSRSLSERRTMS